MAKIESGVEFDKDEQHNKLTKNLGDNQQYTLRIPRHLYKAVKLKLIKENRKLRPVLVEMLEKYIKI
jgi:hypothetical protein